MRWVSKHIIQVDSVGVQINTDNIWRGVIKVKVAGVHTHDKWTRSVEDACQRQRAQGDVGTLPLEGKDHLRRDTREGSDYYDQAHKKTPFCLFVCFCIHSGISLSDSRIKFGQTGQMQRVSTA